MSDPTTTTPSRLHEALQGGSVPADLITSLRDLLGQLDFVTGAADRAAEHYPDHATKRPAYCEASLTMVLDAFARLWDGAPLAGGTG